MRSNSPTKVLPVVEELKMQECKGWDLVNLSKLSRYQQALVLPTQPADLIILAIGIIDSFKPTTQELIDTAVLENFTATWEGYIRSLERSQNKEPFFRLLVDQVDVRKDQFQKLNNSNGNLMMLLKFYVSLCALQCFGKDQTLISTLKWLKDKIISMRKALYSIRAQVNPDCGYIQNAQDKFTKQCSQTYNSGSFEKQELKKRDQIVQNWIQYLSSFRK